MSALYLILNAAVISIPLAFSWHGKMPFSSHWKSFFPGCLVVLAGFIIWDIPFADAGVWGFNEAYHLGILVAGLPLEEWLFFLCIPYACTFTHFALSELEINWFDRSASWLTACLLLLSAALAVVFWGHLYTTVTSILLAAFCVWLLWRQPNWLGGLWTAFVALIPAFIATNGVLTGIRFWEYPVINLSPEAVTDQVVWYDNAHNMGVRLFSIPADDFLYAFLLIGLNVAVFEALRARNRQLSKTA